MYKRIASARGQDELEAIREEMVDRFGRTPDALRTLFQITAIKLRATPLGMVKADIGARGGRVQFQPQANIDPAQVIALIQNRPKQYRLDGSDKLKLTMELPDPTTRVDALTELIDTLSSRAAA